MFHNIFYLNFFFVTFFQLIYLCALVLNFSFIFYYLPCIKVCVLYDIRQQRSITKKSKFYEKFFELIFQFFFQHYSIQPHKKKKINEVYFNFSLARNFVPNGKHVCKKKSRVVFFQDPITKNKCKILTRLSYVIWRFSGAGSSCKIFTVKFANRRTIVLNLLWIWAKSHNIQQIYILELQSNYGFFSWNWLGTKCYKRI